MIMVVVTRCSYYVVLGDVSHDHAMMVVVMRYSYLVTGVMIMVTQPDSKTATLNLLEFSLNKTSFYHNRCRRDLHSSSLWPTVHGVCL